MISTIGTIQQTRTGCNIKTEVTTNGLVYIQYCCMFKNDNREKDHSNVPVPEQHSHAFYQVDKKSVIDSHMLLEKKIVINCMVKHQCFCFNISM